MEILILGIILLLLLLILYYINNRRSCKCGCVKDNYELVKDNCGLYPLQGLKPEDGGEPIDPNSPCARFVQAP